MKYTIDYTKFGRIWSLPSRECGLKYNNRKRLAILPLSLPSRECGLKLTHRLRQKQPFMSLPSRECGLKLESGGKISLDERHSPRGSVD